MTSKISAQCQIDAAKSFFLNIAGIETEWADKANFLALQFNVISSVSVSYLEKLHLITKMYSKSLSIKRKYLKVMCYNQYQGGVGGPIL